MSLLVFPSILVIFACSQSDLQEIIIDVRPWSRTTNESDLPHEVLRSNNHRTTETRRITKQKAVRNTSRSAIIKMVSTESQSLKAVVPRVQTSYVTKDF